MTNDQSDRNGRLQRRVVDVVCHEQTQEMFY